MDHKLIEFPKWRSRKIEEKNLSESKQVLIAFSMISFVLIAIFTNEQILKGQRPIYTISDNSQLSQQKQDRAIASFDAMDSLRDVQWEHELAIKLGNDKSRSPASYGRKPSAAPSIENLRMILSGYRILLSPEYPNKIQSIEYIESESTDFSENPISVHTLVNYENLFQNYRAFFPISYAYAKKINSTQKTDSQTEVYQLMNDAGQETGKAVFKLNDQNRVLALYFSQ